MKTLTLSHLWIVLFSVPISAAPGEITKQIPTPGKTSTGLTYDGQHIWVADHGLDELLAIDPQTGQLAHRLKSPGYRPAGLAFDGTHLWNVDPVQLKIYRIQPIDGVSTRTIPSPVALPRALTFDGKALWVSDDQQKRIHQVDPQDGTTISQIPFPGASVDGLGFDGRYLWVADRIADRLYAVHPPSGEVVITLPSPGPHPTGIAYNGKELLVSDYQTDRIYWVQRDGPPDPLTSEWKETYLSFTHQVRNFGPDPLPELFVNLAIPQDRANQKLLAPVTFDPKPEEILTDSWGQPIARFRYVNLPSSSVATVRMKAHVSLSSFQQIIFPEKVLDLREIPLSVRRTYLGDTLKFDLKNPVIQKAVSEAVGSERNPYWIARKIYRYLHDHLTYERVGGWDVAPLILQRGSGSCSEYSYVFVAMCRAAGLPARFVGSFVVRNDAASYDDIYHRWVEVYLPPYGWVSVDPSRGDKPTEAERANSFGHLGADVLITTVSGGESKWLGWNYNHNETFSCQGRCKVEVEGIAEWSPEDPDQKP